MFNIEPKSKQKWFETRRWIAYILVRLAKRIYPESPEVTSFLYKAMIEQMICGSVVIKAKNFIPTKKHRSKTKIERL